MFKVGDGDSAVGWVGGAIPLVRKAAQEAIKQVSPGTSCFGVRGELARRSA